MWEVSSWRCGCGRSASGGVDVGGQLLEVWMWEVSGQCGSGPDGSWSSHWGCTSSARDLMKYHSHTRT